MSKLAEHRYATADKAKVNIVYVRVNVIFALAPLLTAIHPRLIFFRARQAPSSALLCTHSLNNTSIGDGWGEESEDSAPKQHNLALASKSTLHASSTRSSLPFFPSQHFHFLPMFCSFNKAYVSSKALDSAGVLRHSLVYSRTNKLIGGERARGLATVRRTNIILSSLK
jgi:hypothetical protein